jgi:uncharacterized protein YmfQ (DUF2313 family)
MQFLRGMADVWGAFVDKRLADLLELESDPRSTVDLLPEWERAFGLPDDCLAEPVSIADRQKALTARIATLGGQQPEFFVRLAAGLGYTIRIAEHMPFMCGVSEVGDTRPVDGPVAGFRWEIGPESMRPYWTVLVLNPRLSWFRVGASEVGVDPHLRIGIATDLECLIRRFGPAHTVIYFDYSGLALGGEFSGTP